MKRRYPVAGFGVLALAFGGVISPAARPAPVKACPEAATAVGVLSDAPTTDESHLGMQWHRGRPYVARLDARTLRPRSRSRVPVSTVVAASPDDAHLVSGLGGDFVPDGGRMRLKFLDLANMRVEAEVPLGAGGGVHSVHWFDDDRVIAVVGQPVRAFVVDAASFQLLEEIPVDVGQVFEVRGTDDSVVVFAAASPGSTHPSERRITPTRLHVVTTAGELRSTDVIDVRAGYEFDPELGGRHRYPGLAVDERGRSAFIVDSLRRVAEVDLSSMEVAYRTVGDRASLWSRLLSFFGSVAEAKLSTGPSMHAHHLPNGSLLVEGVNEGPQRSPVHMTMIDTETWEPCRLDSNMNHAAVGEDVIVTWDSIVRLGQGRSARTRNSSGLAVYDLEGRQRFEVLQDTPICWVDLAGATAYAYKCGQGVAAIDVTTGDVRHLRPGRPIQLVMGDMTL